MNFSISLELEDFELGDISTRNNWNKRETFWLALMTDCCEPSNVATINNISDRKFDYISASKYYLYAT